MSNLSNILRKLVDSLNTNGVTLKIFDKWMAHDTMHMDCCPWSRPDPGDGPDTCICCALKMTIENITWNNMINGHVHFCGDYSEGEYLCKSISKMDLEEFVINYIRKKLY